MANREKFNTETKQQHAPGPYHGEGRMVKLDISHGKRQTIARVDDAKILAPGYAEATAKLLAAAPDMLDTLATIRDTLEAWAETHERIARNSPDGPACLEQENIAKNYRHLIDTADKALNKAKGE